MLPFHVDFQPGAPVYEQVVYAAKKAVVSGALRPGDRFPSVRNLSQELKINPNTAHKVVSTLMDEGLLEVRPGIGTLVAEGLRADREARSRLLSGDVERLVVEAMKLAIDPDDLTAAIRQTWQRLEKGQA